MNTLSHALKIAGVLLCLGSAAQAQQQQCQQPVLPKTVSASTYTVSATDNCWLVLFTGTGTVTVSLPAPGLIFTPGFSTTLLPTNGAFLTIVGLPDDAGKTHQINGGNSLSLTTGQGAALKIQQDSNWYALSTGSGYLNITDGLVLQGQGSTSDLSLKNKAGTTVATIPTGANELDIFGLRLLNNQINGIGLLVNTPSNATPVTIGGLGGPILQNIATDATHTDATVCEDTTTHALYFGSGTAGICLGTSSLRFKWDVRDLRPGLAEVLATRPIAYRYRSGYGGEGVKYGFAAEEVEKTLPELVGHDAEGLPNAVDWAGAVPVLWHALQEQQREIEALKARLN